MNKKIETGDFFCFTVAENASGYGQIILSKTLQFIIIFEPVFSNHEEDTSKILSSVILLSGWTMDGRFISGNWNIIGNGPTPEVNFPEYKVGLSPDCRVTDINGRFLRQASRQEEAQLQFKTTHSPIAYEKAFYAHHFGEWEDRFNSLIHMPLSLGRGSEALTRH